MNALDHELGTHSGAVKCLFDDLQPGLESIAKEINRISRSTQEWNIADEYHKDIISRITALNEKDSQIANTATEAYEKLQMLRQIQAPIQKKTGETGRTNP